MFPVTRLRRLRQSNNLRALIQESFLRPEQFIYPIFVAEGATDNAPIKTLPDQYRIAEKNLPTYIKQLYQEGIRAVLLFGVSNKKDDTGSDSLKETGLLARMIHSAKTAEPNMLVVADNCFCEYTTHGHCGIVKTKGTEKIIDNDLTLQNLAQQALICAKAGADMLAPSAMMDGQIHTMRQTLDQSNFSQIPLMAYSTKFCSHFYGPFREAADSNFKGDRQSYQMPYTNAREALRESLEDEKEGADILMVKPAGTALDILAKLRQNSLLPLAAYQVSGEYAAIKFGAMAGAFAESQTMLESLISIKRAGADIIISYFARDFIKLYSCA